MTHFSLEGKVTIVTGANSIDVNAYITGTILPVDGGIVAGRERYDLPPPAGIATY